MNLRRFTVGKEKDANDAMTPERFDLTGAALVQMQDEVDGLTEIIGRILDGRDPNVRGATLAWFVCLVYSRAWAHRPRLYRQDAYRSDPALSAARRSRGACDLVSAFADA